MKSQQPNWPPSPQPLHSMEIEHRLTAVETIQDERSRVLERDRRQTNQDLRAIISRLTLHERAILFLAGVVSVLLQDKWPALAEIIRGLVLK